MNCRQFNSISLEEVLLSLGHLPTKQNEKEAWYLNPFASESQASFKFDKRQNVWYLHSEGIGGNNTDFMKKYLKASIKEVLEWAEKQNFSSFEPQSAIQRQNITKPNYQIAEIKELQNEHLKNYLLQRGLSEMVFPFVKEVHFQMGEKKLYAVGFQNLSEGWELRNSFYKGAVLKKDISIININDNAQYKNHKNTSVAVFEGFIDALSFIEMRKSYTGDLLIMNSIALLNKTKEHLKDYSEIHLFLDNDPAGIKCKNDILKNFPKAKDHSEIYSAYKDLNEYMVEIKIEIEEKYEKEKNNLRQKEQQENQPAQIYRRKR
ncbi:MAG: toprim domain-containing protein [Flavobacteriaceae bacterium]|uniref:Toprim-like n=1 Tax=Chryseobacterium taichungense TaxID=295069 RepID=A0A1H8A280_9FLAO|nr:toprim domain-containing protein [Chryseobacterium taichungense]SEM64845.1 Toprim-like [Chryseobacterium taichungense]